MKKLYILAGVALLIWLIIQFPSIMINPGKLVAEHQEISDQCLKCHDPFFGISSDKCMSCHELAEIGKDESDSTISFHAKLANVNCISCHTDHRGLHPTGLSMFDHDMLPADDKANCGNCHSVPVDELHSLISVDCGTCHITEGWASSISFSHDQIQTGKDRNCIACHNKPTDDFHQSGTDSCGNCHSTTKWIPSTFDHSDFFVFDEHHETQCSTCHANHNYSTYTCFGCHEHSESSIREEHLEEGITDFTDCASCHRSGEEDEAESHRGDGKSGDDEAKKIQQYLEKNGKGHKDEDDD